MVAKHARSKSRTAPKALSERRLAQLYRGLTPVPPPKSVEELAKEQGIDLDAKVDWVALATAVWPTQEDVEDFEQHLRDIRGRPSE